MSLRPENLRVGISVGLMGGDDPTWVNGMVQNVIYAYRLFRRMPGVSEVFLLNIADSWNGQPDYPKRFGLEVRQLHLGMEGIDLLIELGCVVPTLCKQNLQEKGGKVVSYVAGNSFIMTLEGVVLQFKDRGEIYPDRVFDACWMTPQHIHTNKYYVESIKRVPVSEIPQVWDPICLETALNFTGLNFGYTPGKKKHKVAVFEPNIDVVKTFHFPLLICEEAFREEPKLLEHVFLTNTLRFKGNPHFEELIGALDLKRYGKVTSEGRFATPVLMSQHADFVVTHQWENALNYLYYDVLYGNYPLIHNSPLIRDCGYYYPDFDTKEGGRVLARALREHDHELLDYQHRAQAVLRRVASNSPENIGAHAKLVDALYH